MYVFVMEYHIKQTNAFTLETLGHAPENWMYSTLLLISSSKGHWLTAAVPPSLSPTLMTPSATQLYGPHLLLLIRRIATAHAIQWLIGSTIVKWLVELVV